MSAEIKKKERKTIYPTEKDVPILKQRKKKGKIRGYRTHVEIYV